MSKTIHDDKWFTVKILTEQKDEIEKILKTTNDFLSMPEFVRVAINEKLRSANK